MQSRLFLSIFLITGLFISDVNAQTRIMSAEQISSEINQLKDEVGRLNAELEAKTAETQLLHSQVATNLQAFDGIASGGRSTLSILNLLLLIGLGGGFFALYRKVSDQEFTRITPSASAPVDAPDLQPLKEHIQRLEQHISEVASRPIPTPEPATIDPSIFDELRTQGSELREELRAELTEITHIQRSLLTQITQYEEKIATYEQELADLKANPIVAVPEDVQPEPEVVAEETVVDTTPTLEETEEVEAPAIEPEQEITPEPEFEEDFAAIEDVLDDLDEEIEQVADEPDDELDDAWFKELMEDEFAQTEVSETEAELVEPAEEIVEAKEELPDETHEDISFDEEVVSETDSEVDQEEITEDTPELSEHTARDEAAEMAGLFDELEEEAEVSASTEQEENVVTESSEDSAIIVEADESDSDTTDVETPDESQPEDTEESAEPVEEVESTEETPEEPAKKKDPEPKKVAAKSTRKFDEKFATPSLFDLIDEQLEAELGPIATEEEAEEEISDETPEDVSEAVSEIESKEEGSVARAEQKEDEVTEAPFDVEDVSAASPAEEITQASESSEEDDLFDLDLDEMERELTATDSANEAAELTTEEADVVPEVVAEVDSEELVLDEDIDDLLSDLAEDDSIASPDDEEATDEELAFPPTDETEVEEIPEEVAAITEEPAREETVEPEVAVQEESPAVSEVSDEEDDMFADPSEEEAAEFTEEVAEVEKIASVSEQKNSESGADTPPIVTAREDEDSEEFAIDFWAAVDELEEKEGKQEEKPKTDTPSQAVTTPVAKPVIEVPKPQIQSKPEPVAPPVAKPEPIAVPKQDVAQSEPVDAPKKSLQDALSRMRNLTARLGDKQEAPKETTPVAKSVAAAPAVSFTPKPPVTPVVPKPPVSATTTEVKAPATPAPVSTPEESAVPKTTPTPAPVEEVANEEPVKAPERPRIQVPPAKPKPVVDEPPVPVVDEPTPASEPVVVPPKAEAPAPAVTPAPVEEEKPIPPAAKPAPKVETDEVTTRSSFEPRQISKDIKVTVEEAGKSKIADHLEERLASLKEPEQYAIAARNYPEEQEVKEDWALSLIARGRRTQKDDDIIDAINLMEPIVKQGGRREGFAHQIMADGLYTIGIIRQEKNFLTKALAHYKQVTEKSGYDGVSMYTNWGNALIQLYYLTGKQAYLKEALDKFKVVNNIYTHAGNYHIARVFNLMGDQGVAMEWLEKAFKFNIKVPKLDDIQKEPAFKNLRGNPALDKLFSKYRIR